ncbi:butyrophilin subfamily 1 member A1-like isoform X1 [Simochromis diagramma]|uniref:butyrophilin subfamily 1 member A1-like isoform X1 n=1 Tax=Simochromis diagramma TaxID=43689 RepID=UPI001A7E6657|nr:butyrophilin subfamily 1 member A1-like isoform X1 [Simochromis diagramma]
MNSALNTHLLLLLMVFAQLPSSFTKGTIQVIGSSHPIVALVGDDVILPCYLNSSISASDKTVEWTKYKLDPRFVYVWRDGGELESKKNPSYKGRTTVSLHKLKLGDISLNLSKVRLSDRGRYRCFLPDMGETLMELIVGAVSLPVILRVQKAKTGVALQCESAGWYPEPELLWLDGEGNLLSAGPTETLRGPDDLYTVSSRVTVEKRHSNNITCRVQQRNTNQSRETHIYISDYFFTAPPNPAVCQSAHSLCYFTFLHSSGDLCWLDTEKEKDQDSDKPRCSSDGTRLRQAEPKEEMETHKMLEKRRQEN